MHATNNSEKRPHQILKLWFPKQSRLISSIFHTDFQSYRRQGFETLHSNRTKTGSSALLFHSFGRCLVLPQLDMPYFVDSRKVMRMAHPSSEDGLWPRWPCFTVTSLGPHVGSWALTSVTPLFVLPPSLVGEAQGWKGPSPERAAG